MSAVGQLASRYSEAPQTGPVPSGYVRLTCADPACVVTALIGPDGVGITGGYGGWTVIDRPREVSMTVWEGIAPFELTLSLMLDAYAAGLSQEPVLRALNRVARGDRESAPGIVTLDGIPSLPVDEWVIQSMEFGEPIRRTGDMHRTRQPVTIGLTEYVPPEYLLRKKTTKDPSSKTVILKATKGDTLAKIAKRRKIKSWVDIWKLNKGFQRKANAVIKTGTQVRVPATKLASNKRGNRKGGQRNKKGQK